MFLETKNLNLRGLREEDLSYIKDWSNKSEITELMVMGIRPDSGVIYCSWDSTEDEWKRYKESKVDIIFVMILKQSGMIIGLTGFYDINFMERSAELRIAIGYKEYLNKGYGTEAVEALLDYGFNKLNLHKIHLGVNECNIGANKCYKKAGFVYEGTIRDFHFRNGRYYNTNLYSILEEEYREKKNKTISTTSNHRKRRDKSS